MAKRYLKELEEMIQLLDWQPKGGLAEGQDATTARLERVTELCRRGKLTLVQAAQVRRYIQHPSEAAGLFEEYRKLRADRAKRFETDGDARKELSGERGYILGKRFLERWSAQELGSKLPDGGRIPGFEGMGPEAVAGLLQGGPQVDRKQRPVAAVGPGGGGDPPADAGAAPPLVP